jgi:ATP-dependent DNA helicase DinG
LRASGKACIFNLMNRYFTETALLQLRDAIADADGNEVFFLGRTDESRIVFEVEPLARGNRDAVAAIMIATSFSDVVIHNHPSGHLTPSDADIEIASLMGNQGVGFYIIDNGATHCYQAVAPFTRTETVPLSFAEVERWYGPAGDLARGLPGYEHRDEQTRMAFAVAEAFNQERVALIEAGTGTGKSLAYLLPAAFWATRNRERVVISTNTINLQEQLTAKDIPFLQKTAGLSFRAVLVKGRSNYLCRRKLQAVKSEPSLFPDEHAQEVQAILDWSGKTADGCRSDLSIIPRDEVWEEVCCEADQCGRVKCPHYAACFFYRARREASSADILVVNHALLMADLAVRKETGYGSAAILPPFTRLIFDEGHHLEDVATSYLSTQTTRHGLLKLLAKLQHPRKNQRGLLPQLSAQLSREIPEALDALYMEAAGVLEGQLLPGRPALGEAVNRATDRLGTGLFAHLKRTGEKVPEQKLRLTPQVYAAPFWAGAEETVRDLAKELACYAEQMKAFLKICDKLPDRVLEKLAGSLVDLRGIHGRLTATVENLIHFVGRNDEICRWFEASRGPKGMTVRLCASPLEVAASIKAVVLDKFKTVIVTSATLAVGEKFDFLKHRTGVDLMPSRQVSELLLASPFDYAHQAFAGIPADIPEPGSPGFEPALRELLREALLISRGRAFVLFTSYDLLIRTYEALQGTLRTAGLTPMRQGELSRHLLLSRFRTERNAVLFGTDSFWEGVDVQGRALEMVVITRLPFRVPTEPILEARSEHIAATGGDPFRDYTVPQAVIKFKQGFGRLIRSRDDRGAVLILDSRVLSKSYGRHFLGALPGVGMVRGSGDEVCAALRSFFSDSPP